jgi:hypothetical protein
MSFTQWVDRLRVKTNKKSNLFQNIRHIYSLMEYI